MGNGDEFYPSQPALKSQDATSSDPQQPRNRSSDKNKAVFIEEEADYDDAYDLYVGDDSEDFGEYEQKYEEDSSSQLTSPSVSMSPTPQSQWRGAAQQSSSRSSPSEESTVFNDLASSQYSSSTDRHGESPVFPDDVVSPYYAEESLVGKRNKSRSMGLSVSDGEFFFDVSDDLLAEGDDTSRSHENGSSRDVGSTVNQAHMPDISRRVLDKENQRRREHATASGLDAPSSKREEATIGNTRSNGSGHRYLDTSKHARVPGPRQVDVQDFMGASEGQWEEERGSPRGLDEVSSDEEDDEEDEEVIEEEHEEEVANRKAWSRSQLQPQPQPVSSTRSAGASAREYSTGGRDGLDKVSQSQSQSHVHRKSAMKAPGGRAGGPGERKRGGLDGAVQVELELDVMDHDHNHDGNKESDSDEGRGDFDASSALRKMRASGQSTGRHVQDARKTTHSPLSQLQNSGGSRQRSPARTAYHDIHRAKSPLSEIRSVTIDCFCHIYIHIHYSPMYI